MRKNYCQPATEVAEVIMVSQILAGSGGGDPTPASGVNATRQTYANGGSKVW